MGVAGCGADRTKREHLREKSNQTFSCLGHSTSRPINPIHPAQFHRILVCFYFPPPVLGDSCVSSIGKCVLRGDRACLVLITFLDWVKRILFRFLVCSAYSRRHRDGTWIVCCSANALNPLSVLPILMENQIHHTRNIIERIRHVAVIRQSQAT